MQVLCISFNTNIIFFLYFRWQRRAICGMAASLNIESIKISCLLRADPIRIITVDTVHDFKQNWVWRWVKWMSCILKNLSVSNKYREGFLFPFKLVFQDLESKSDFLLIWRTWTMCLIKKNLKIFTQTQKSWLVNNNVRINVTKRRVCVTSGAEHQAGGGFLHTQRSVLFGLSKLKN